MADHFLTLTPSVATESGRSSTSPRFKREPADTGRARRRARRNDLDKPSTGAGQPRGRRVALGMLPSSCDRRLQLGHGETWRTPRASFRATCRRSRSDLCPRPLEDSRPTPAFDHQRLTTSTIRARPRRRDDAGRALGSSRAGGSPSSETEQRGHSLIRRRVPGFGCDRQPEGYRPTGHRGGRPVQAEARVARSSCSPSRPLPSRCRPCTRTSGRPWQGSEREERRKVFAGYTVDEAMMAAAGPGAIFLHCLPAHVATR